MNTVVARPVRAAGSTYKAAVYEHNVHIPIRDTNTILNRSQALEEMMVNIRVFQDQAREAARQVESVLHSIAWGKYTCNLIQIQIQITLFFPEIVHNNYMGIYKMNHRIT